MNVKLLQLSYVLSLRTFRTLSNGEFYFLAFLQRAEAFGLDSSMVYEYVWALFLLNETETFLVVKPFYDASSHN